MPSKKGLHGKENGGQKKEEEDMSIDEMRKAMQEFCRESQCQGCPAVVVHGLCEKYYWPDAPDDLVKKAYLLAFGEVKEDKQMNNIEDAIGKTLEMVRGIVKAGNEAFVVGYIIGVWELTKKLTENKKEATR